MRRGRGGGQGHGEPGPRAHSGEWARGLQLGRGPGCSRREGSGAGTPSPGAPRCLGARTSEGPAVCGDLSRVSRGWSGDPGGPARAGRCGTGPGFRSLEMEPASRRVSVRLLGPSGLVAEAGPLHGSEGAGGALRGSDAKPQRSARRKVGPPTALWPCCHPEAGRSARAASLLPSPTRHWTALSELGTEGPAVAAQPL